MPGKPHGRKKGHAVSARKDFTKNTQVKQLQSCFSLRWIFLLLLFISVFFIFIFFFLKKALTSGFLRQFQHHQH